ncbi:polysaccharide biosynthesis/export family protein [Solemya velum gill symbiont]|nr:polysaccharide biosynthesis/export family protein [Solemya velum gill symbiont]
MSKLNPQPRYFNILLILVLTCLAPLALAVNDDVSNYRVDKGDKFDVYVLNEEDLSVTVEVNDEGTIFFPLLGEVRVHGMTPNQIEKEITRKLKGPYLVKPVVSVTMNSYREFFIGGAVKEPGWYEYQPGMTFQQAVQKAGGFSDLASRSKLYVNKAGSTSEKGDKTTLSHKIKPSDTLFVGESFF